LLGLRPQVLQFASKETKGKGKTWGLYTEDGALVTDIVRPSNFEDRSTEKRDGTF
jgi:hypothetical protein